MDHIGSSVSIYGLHKNTLNSLILTLLPPNGHQYQPARPPPLSPSPAPLSPSPDGTVGVVVSEESGLDKKVHLLEVLLKSLRNSAGFRVPLVSDLPPLACHSSEPHMHQFTCDKYTQVACWASVGTCMWEKAAYTELLT